MYKTILVPLDGSKRAETIFSHVEELARRYDATLVFLRVVEPVPLRLGAERVHADIQQELEERFEQAESYVAGLEEGFTKRGMDTRARVICGPAVETIENTAEQENADLVAIASHGGGKLSRVFYGSVAVGLLHRIDRPLMLIPSRAARG